MKTATFPSLASVLLALVATVPVHATVQATYYVDPVNGSDANNGTSPTTAFATLPAARAAGESVDSSMSGDIIVSLLPGDYLVTAPINLSQLDSGTNGHNVIWTCYGSRGSARIIGGTKVTGWTLDSGNIYKATVAAGTQRFEAIYENGVRGHLARIPNTGYYSIGADDGTNPKSKFQWKTGDSIPTVTKPTDLQVYVWPGNHDWSTEIHDVASVDYSGRWITLTEGIQQAYLGSLTAGSRYFVQGAKELLDQPGEFYYDASAGVMYYYPRNTPIATQEIIVPVVTTVFNAIPTGTDNLSGLWEFENNAEDSSPNGNNGTAVNSPVYVTSLTGLGQAISLDGATQYVTVPDDPTIEFGATSNGFTITAWINTTGTGYQPIVIKARPDPGTFDMDYKFWLNATGQLELTRWNKPNSSNSTVTDTGGPALNDGTWHHVAFVNESATSHKLYIDGSLVTTSTTAWTDDDSNTEAMEIGRFADNNNSIYYYFNGEIDDARIYQSALAAADIAAIYHQTAPGPSPLENIVFSNLKFVGTNLDYTNPGGSNQGMICFQNASNILIENNEFDNVGGSAVYCGGPGTAISVIGNSVSDAGVAGISLGSVSNSLVSNNQVQNTAQVFADGGSNVHLDTVTGTTVSYNNLSISKRHGIRMHTSPSNTIEFNEVYLADQDSQDCGAVYFGYSDGNVFNNNRVHDSGANFGQQHGFYVEDGSDHNTITNNLVYVIGTPGDSATAPINVKGVGNVIQNNVFDFTKSHAGLRTFEIKANAPANSEQILNNIFYSGGTSVTLYDFQSYADNRIQKSDDNDFYKTASGAYVMYNIPGDDTLSNWEAILSKKYDQHSVTSNPLFVDAANHNYTLQSGSPALGLGFVQISTAAVGLQPDFILPATTGQWVFSGGTTDITLNGNNGTQVGGTFVADRFGTASSAISLNGSTDYVNVSSNALLTFGNPSNLFSIVAWVKTTGTGTAGIVSKARDTNTPNMDYRLLMLAGGTVQLSRWNQSAGITDSVTTTATVNDGNWHQIVFVNASASSHLIYLDGVLSVTSTATWTSDDTNTEPVRFGQDKNGTTSDNFFNGLIDDVAIIDSALTASQIQDLNHIPHS